MLRIILRDKEGKIEMGCHNYARAITKVKNG
jgi:hypothetical protein